MLKKIFRIPLRSEKPYIKKGQYWVARDNKKVIKKVISVNGKKIEISSSQGVRKNMTTDSLLDDFYLCTFLTPAHLQKPKSKKIKRNNGYYTLG